jgi:hypothetical protein
VALGIEEGVHLELSVKDRVLLVLKTVQVDIHQVEAGSCLGVEGGSFLGVVEDSHLRVEDSCLGVLESSQLEEEAQIHLAPAVGTEVWHLLDMDYYGS